MRLLRLALLGLTLLRRGIRGLLVSRRGLLVRGLRLPVIIARRLVALPIRRLRLRYRHFLRRLISIFFLQGSRYSVTTEVSWVDEGSLSPPSLLMRFMMA